ncbi:MAG: helix-turn-helix transcriptional regulator [Lentisphaerae bacterium]|jgi:DNA-binding transcriptional ArsR family regulator|nr:helix-turn-helix transcriptional regulator [Lentisphaerota bacterium]MBT4818354.1 helix-turn-helix transcriptional regulator [Lentisphaerota bacterium]MBT5607919.1 helix-turn-helix transcriptional regulator [Lentisphaerota bacterium]MBT7056561.1 helix-turn-helix transcriptional regulator [Lentisphaerota bacterium]MBT7846352.1 helix-turn-helix transcriptional regulator [Lentisphaerota bacterium]
MWNQQRLASASRVMHALAHPVRLAVMQCLEEREMTVTELYEAVGCSQSMMSQQLQILENQGLIKGRKEGATKHCSIRNPDFLKLFVCMSNHLETILRVPTRDE